MSEEKTLLKLNNGIMISVEGIDGAGKGTVVQFFKEAFAASHLASVSFADLDSTAIGKSVRGLFLGKPAEDADDATKAAYEENRPNPDTELLLIAAARNENILRNVIPALSAGYIVIMDRYTDSTEVYQHHIKGAQYGNLALVNLMVCQDIKPKITFWVNTSPAVAAQRMSDAGKGDYHESKGRDFHEAVWVSFARLHQNEITRIATINGDGDLEAVRAEVYAAVGNLIRMLARSGFLPKEWVEVQTKASIDKMNESITAAEVASVAEAADDEVTTSVADTVANMTTDGSVVGTDTVD